MKWALELAKFMDYESFSAGSRWKLKSAAAVSIPPDDVAEGSLPSKCEKITSITPSNLQRISAFHRILCYVAMHL